MKHADLMDERDKADLQKAQDLTDAARALRARVLSRLRARAFRKKRHD